MMTQAGNPQKPPRLAVQAFWLMVAKTIGFLLTIALPMLLVRIFSREQYGLFRQAFVVIGTSYSMLGMAVGVSAFYYLPRKSEGRSQIALNILLFNLTAGTAGFLLFTLYPKLLIRLLGGAQLVPYGWMIGTVVLLTVFSSFLEYIATALQDVKSSSVFIVFAQLSRLVLITLAAVLWSTLKALLVAAILQGLLQSAILICYLYRQFGPFWKSFDRRFFLEQMGYAMPFGASGILFTVQNDLHHYFVSNAFEPAAFAIYAIGCTQIPLIGILRDSITTVLTSRISELQHQGKPRDIFVLTVKAMRTLSLAYLPLWAFLLVVGRDLLVLFYTRAYEASWPIFAVNLTMMAVLIVVVDPILRAHAEHRYFIVQVRAFLLVIEIAALWLGIRTIGMVGAVLALVLIGLTERLLVGRRAAKILGVGRADLPQFADIGKIGLLAAASACPALLLRHLMGGAHPLIMISLTGAVFGAAYAAGLLRCRVLTAEERELVRQQIQRLRRSAPARVRT